MKAYGEITLTVINDGSDGTSPYFISVGNESQNIPCGNDGLASTNFLIEIPFVGYHGVQRIGCVATISSLPNGVTLGENTAATTENDGRIILNVAKGADFGGTDVLTGTIDFLFTIGDTTLKRKFTWTKTKDGEVGKLYQLSPSSLVIKKGSDNSLSPATIIFSSTVTDGNSVQKLPYAGRFVIEESTNGGTYTSKYISPEDESNKEYTPSSTNVKVIKATLYAAGGIKNALDTQSVIVLTDIDNVDGALEEIRSEVAGVSSKVDSVEKSIKNEVWKDTIIKVVDKDGNVVEKTIENIIVDSSQDINGIKNEVKKVTTKYDGDIATLEEKVAKSEQNIDGFKQTVSETYETKENATQNYSELAQTSTEIKGTISNLQGQITSVKQTADSVDTEIKNAKGDSTTLKARIDGISVVANNADGKITKLEASVDGISSEINDAKGNSTTLKARLDGVDSIVKDSNNKYSSLKQTVDGFKQTVSEEYETKNDATKKETEIKQNIEGFKSTVSSKYATKEEINSLQIGDRFDSIETSIEQTNNQISLKASTETVTDIDNRANQLDKALSDALITINKNSDAIASLTARDFKVEFTTLTNQLTQLNGDLTSYKKEVGNWMRFDADGNLVLGATREEGQDAYELKLTKSRISFMLNDVEVAYISNNELYITNSTVVQNLKIGRFVWEVRGNGNLGLVWR